MGGSFVIGSETRLVAIIGSPIVQVKYPDNFNRYFADEGVDRATMVIDLVPERVADFVTTVRGWQNMDGFVVTIPHKAAVAALVDELSAKAQFLGVANVVRRHPNGKLCGDMTDGEGFLTASRPQGFVPNGKVVLVVGAGAAGSAIGYTLAGAGVSHLVISDRNKDRAASLCARLSNALQAVSISAGAVPQRAFDLVVNASLSGMQYDDPLPVPHSTLAFVPPEGLVADVVTSPKMTPLLTLAKARGLKIQTGEEMAKSQLFALGKVMGIFRGVPVDV